VISRASRAALANSLRGAARGLKSGGLRFAIASGIALGSTLAFAAGTAWTTAAVLDAAAAALSQLPGLRAPYLVERALAAVFDSAGVLLLLGALTTGVSTLFLSGELPALLVLPIPHASLFRRQLLRTAGSSAAPMLLLLLPALGVAVARSPRPLAALVSGLALLSALALAAGAAGSAGALLLVRLVPPRRAFLLAAAVSAIGLSTALIGFRGSRPERLFDPLEALSLLETFGRTPPPAPGLDPGAHAARALARSLFGDQGGVLPSLFALGTAIALLAATARWLAPAHRRALEDARLAPPSSAAAPRRRAVGSLDRSLLRSEAAALFREASTPAQLGSLLAVFVLQFLNLAVLPRGDAASRDVLLGLETAVTLFLVAALSLRFAYPSVSSDGRAALVLRSLPLPPSRHLLHRYLVRAAPTAAAGIALSAASVAILSPPRPAALAALGVSSLGALALPALQLGLGALFPRYDAPSAVAVALGPGGLFTLVLSTALSAAAALAVSGELRLLFGTLAGKTIPGTAILISWCGAALVAGTAALALGARALSRADLSGG
jgi:ABC-2 type transport system permease protein